jgi:hypothetical protein
MSASSEPQYDSTLQLVDVNHDGKADVCGRGILGIYCAVSLGTTFGSASLWQSNFNDITGWIRARASSR